MLSEKEQHHLEQFPGIDIGQVGGRVGMGAQHVVRCYGQEKVIKYTRVHALRDPYSRVASPIFMRDPDGLRRDFDLCHEYFGAHVVPVEIQTDRRNACYCLFQRKLDLVDLTPTMVQSTPELREELEEMVCRNKQLLAAKGVWLDIKGWDSRRTQAMAPYLSNLTLAANDEEKPRLQLFDCGIFHPPKTMALKLWHRFLRVVQESNLRRFGIRTRLA